MFLPRRISSSYLVPLILFAGAAVAIVQTGSETYDPKQGISSDSNVYLQMISSGGYDAEVIKPFCFRVLIPFLGWLLAVIRGADPASLDSMITSFKVINFFSIIGIGFGTMALLKRFQVSNAAALIVSLGMFLTYPVLRTCGVPLTDAPGHASVVILVALLVWEKWYWASAWAFVAIFTRESGLIAIVIAALLMLSWHAWLRIAAATLPSFLAYMIFRFMIAPQDVGYQLNPVETLGEMARTYGSSHGIYLVILEVLICFTGMWVLAGIGFLENREEVRFSQFVVLAVPLAFVVPFLIGSHFARVWFAVFPVIALYAGVSVEHWVRENVGRIGTNKVAENAIS